MMIHRKLFNIKLFISFSLLIGLGFSQPKLNIQLGGGFYSPSLIGLDPDSNNVLPKASFLSKNLLLLSKEKSISFVIVFDSPKLKEHIFEISFTI